VLRRALWRLVEYSKKLLAGQLAASTRGSADATVFVLLRVSLALLGGFTTRELAELQGDAKELAVGLILARQQASRGVADVCAIEVQANAERQLVDIVLREACVRTCQARLGALEACFDALG
jgi:hypothetical protein